MDVVRSERELVRSSYPADIIRRLEYRVVTPARSCGLIPGGERARDGDDQHLRQLRRVVKVLHSEIAQVIEIVDAFLAKCPKPCSVEGIDNSRTQDKRVTQNKRLRAHFLIAFQQRKRACTVVGRRRVIARKFIAA